MSDYMLGVLTIIGAMSALILILVIYAELTGVPGPWIKTMMEDDDE